MLFPSKIEDHEYDCVIEGKISKIRIGDIKTKYTVIVFYPLDFTFVCPTEITKLSDMHDKFASLGATILFSSCDSVYSHLAWSTTERSKGGVGEVTWPMISDISHKLCSQFNLFNENDGIVMRSTVILDEKKNVIHISANANPIGRSTSEIVRLIKAFEFNGKYGEICSVDFECD